MTTGLRADVSKKEFDSALAEARERINSRLDSILPPAGDIPASLHAAMRHSVIGGGKRFRGVLCIWSHALFGDPFPADALDAACAIEALHAYTLIHDDLPAIDDDDMRRGLPSCHAKYGEAVAILAGDALQALAFEILSGAGSAPVQNRIAAVNTLAAASGSRMLVGGQVADIEGEGKAAAPDTVRYIHSNKTAALISASMTIGAELAVGRCAATEEIGRIGKDVGLAFQITDDLLDIEGSQEAVGKTLRKDSKREKITWPACFGADASRQEARRIVESSITRIKAAGDRGLLGLLFRYVLERIS